MGFGSLWHWVIVLAIVLILFGRGRVAEIMGDFGKGIKSFKQGINDDDTAKPADAPAARIEGPAPASTTDAAKPAGDSAEPQPAPRSDTPPA